MAGQFRDVGTDHPFKLLVQRVRTPSDGWRWLVYRDRDLVAISILDRVYATVDEAKAEGMVRLGQIALDWQIKQSADKTTVGTRRLGGGD
jgi:hypothetical protein